MAKSKKLNASNSPKESPDFPMVGIGASAGGLEAITQLIRQLPQDLPMALIVVQHLDPTHESMSPEILSRTTRISVIEAKDELKVKPGQVYVIPSNHNLSISKGVLKLSPRIEKRGLHLPIDYFFRSLAKDQKSRAIGVVLSGTASDGTQGLQAIKEEGGLTFAQTPESAKHDGMPRSAIASGAVDRVLSPQAIAQELVALTDRSHQLQQADHRAEVNRSRERPNQTAENDSLKKIFALLQDRSRVNFSHYKQTTIRRRIARRMTLHKMKTSEDYFKYLEAHPQETEALFNDMLINVTEFFRDSDIFAAFKKKIIPKVSKHRTEESPIRIWVIGCATGEEVYSVAICLLEFLGDTAQNTRIQIFATDVSEKAIQQARAGVYPESISKKVSQQRLKRFFVKTEAGYKIKKTIRDLCLFSRHDVSSDPPFTKIDLICCRNLLIYFDADLQKQVLSLLHYALNPDGFLWLGRSESVGDLSPLFRVIDKTTKFYSRGASSPRLKMKFATRTHKSETPPPATVSASATVKDSALQSQMEQMLIAEYAPPGVVVTGDMEIILARGDTAPFLQLPSGQSSLNLFKMARSGMATDLRMAVQQAKKQGARVKREGLTVDHEGRRRFFNISVTPLKTVAKDDEIHFLVLFERAPETPGKASQRGQSAEPKERRIQQLEKQLAEAKSDLQALIDDFDNAQRELTSSNEEMQNANEELLSTNEEMQSTNEELETAKEELQSTNEELTVVNDELQNRNSQLLHTGNDLINLMAAVDIPIVLVGADGRIRRFTPATGELLNLISGDIGRPIGNVKPEFEGPNLQDLVSQVAQTGKIHEEEVCDHKGRWFRLRVLPYKTEEHKVDGAVVSLLDITLLKEHLTRSETALNYATSVAETLLLPLVVLDERLCLLSANRSFAKMAKALPQKLVGENFMTVLGGDGWHISQLRRLLTEVFTRDRELTNFEIERDFPEFGHRIMLLNARQIRWQNEMPKALLLSMEDVTERKMLARELEHSEERFRTLVESAHDAILIVGEQAKIEFVNRQLLSWFGYAPGELEGKNVEVLIPESFQSSHIKHRNRYVAESHPRRKGETLELFARRKDGSEFPVDISLAPMKAHGGSKITAIIRDTSAIRKFAKERELLLEREKEARAEAERANEAKDVFLATLSHELRTPLTAILSWSQLLKRGQMSPDQLRHGMDTIERNARTQGQLINDLLDISRIRSGKLSLELSEADPAEIVRAAVESVRLMAESKKIAIEIADNNKTGKVMADPAKLQQVIWNLLTNAIKFSPEGSPVEISIDKTREHGRACVAIQVIDRGKGIDPSFLPDVFTRFSQQDSSSTRVHGGLGIGLALVRDLVKAHSGSVKAESAGKGQGSTFTVQFPLLREGGPDTELATAARPPRQGRLPPDLSGVKVLIVDDEPSTLEAFVEIVKSFGGQPYPYGSVREAMAAFEKFKPDVIVSDIAMPAEDGHAFIRKIRDLSPEQGGQVPAMAVTAYAAHHDIQSALTSGFQEHMAKPVDDEEFGHAIARLTGVVRT